MGVTGRNERRITTTKEYQRKRSVRQALDLSNQLIQIAREVGSDYEDDDYLLLWGIVLDCAYKIRNEAKHWGIKIESEEDSWGNAAHGSDICPPRLRSAI